jgi:hypothetical protein
VDAISARLDLAWNHVEKPKVAEVPKADPGAHVDETPAGPEWTYLGPIHEADRSLAIISVDGHQKILPEGRTFGDTKLVSVDNDGISVEVKGVPKHIDRGERSSSTVAWVRNLQNSTPQARPAAIPGQPGAGPGNNMNAEIRDRLQRNGIPQGDPGQNWRNGGGQRGPGGGNNGPGNGNNGGGGDRRFRGNGGGGGGIGNDARNQRGDAAQPIAVPIKIGPNGAATVISTDGVARSVN